MADIQYTGQIIAEAPEIMAYKLGLLADANDLLKEDISLPAYQAAGLSDMQKAAIAAGNLYAGAGQGIGGYSPFMQTAGDLSTTAQGYLSQAGTGIGSLNVSPYYALAQTGMQEAAGAASSLSPYADLMNQGYGNISQGSTTLDAATQAAGAGMGQFDPSSVSAYQNPYQQAVIDEAIKQIDRQGQIAENNLAAQAVRSGAFGGTREGVQRAELTRNLSDMKNQAILGGLQSGYNQSMANAMQAYEAGQQRNLGTAQALGALGQAQSQQGLMGAQLAGQQASLIGNQAQLQSAIAQGIGSLAGQEAQTELARAQGFGQIGQGIGALGAQEAALAAQAQALGQGDLNTYLSLGALQAQQAQADLDAQRATDLQKTMFPYQQLGFLSDIYRGAPSSQSSLTAQSSPGTNPLVTAAGVGLGIAGAAKGLSSIG